MAKSHGRGDGSNKKNKTWELMELPNEAKKFGMKWIYKTKFTKN